jgi:hypothetical protein
MRLYIVLIAIPSAAIFVPALLTWAKDLDAIARRMRKLEEQNKIVSFWDNWMKTVSVVVPQKEEQNAKTESLIRALTSSARHLIADAGSEAVSIYRSSEYRAWEEYKLTFAQFQTYRAGISWYRRAFLLYKAPNFSAKVFKIMFHIVAAGTILAFIPRPFRRTLFGGFDGVLPWLGPPHSVQVFLNEHPILGYLLYSAYCVGVAILTRQRSIKFENDSGYFIRDEVARRFRPEEVPSD